MNREAALNDIRNTLGFFERTISVLEEADSAYAPTPDMYTVAGHVVHAADSVTWFVDGAFGKGWDMDFASAAEKAKAETSLEAAKAWLKEAFANAAKVIASQQEEKLQQTFPADDLILPGAIRLDGIVGGIADHTAHHRGALAVYARLLGKVSPMPYAP